MRVGREIRAWQEGNAATLVIMLAIIMVGGGGWGFRLFGGVFVGLPAVHRCRMARRYLSVASGFGNAWHYCCRTGQARCTFPSLRFLGMGKGAHSTF